MVTLTIKTGNAAFQPSPEYEINRILLKASKLVLEGKTNFPLYDLNGNVVGNLNTEPEDNKTG